MRTNKRAIFWLTSPGNRFIAALAVGAFSYLLIPDFPEIRFVLTYDVVIITYLTALAIRMTAATADDTFRISQAAEPSNFATLTLAVLFTGTGLGAVGLLLDNTVNWPPLKANLHLGLSLMAIFLSWLLVHVFFGIHYARLYYDEDTGQESLAFRKGLDFPDQELVDFWDFMYYSFTIALCYQTSDISIKSIVMRRLTLVHAILSFLYVSIIIGLVVNVISNLV